MHFVDIRDAGDPVENAAFYQAEGADELAMLDIAATVENRKTRLEWVRNVSAKLRIPLTVGGGIGSLEDIEHVLAAGASKVSMNSAAVKEPALIQQAAARFGVGTYHDCHRRPTQSGASLRLRAGGVRRNETGGPGRRGVGQTLPGAGRGTLLPTSMDGDGTLAGYDLEFTRAIADAVTLPVVASGGAGTLEHFYQAVVEGHASVVLAASVFHFRKFSIGQVKDYLRSRGVAVVS